MWQNIVETAVCTPRSLHLTRKLHPAAVKTRLAGHVRRAFIWQMAVPQHLDENGRDYEAAIAALNTLQSNFAIVDAIRKAGKSMNKNSLPEMTEWWRRVGYEPSDLRALKAIHVAGTKGKGSTSAFISSILCQYIQNNESSSRENARKLQKVGLYTSPHLQSVRERIQINNQPISESSFVKYFFEVWDRLEAAEARMGPPDFIPMPNSPDAPRPLTKPVYFRYLTLMAYHAYLSEGVDTVIVECGIGGEYDSTNIIQHPNVAAVTTLGIDHTSMLGETIREIAWHKAGIFKKTSDTRAAYTVASQPPEALQVLQERADEKGVELFVIPRHPQIEQGGIRLGLAADFQKTNASLAVAVAAAHLKSVGVRDAPEPLSLELNKQFIKGLEDVQWSGRCEVRREGNLLWHLDGGHTIESIKLASEWFGSSMLKTAATTTAPTKDTTTSSTSSSVPSSLLPQKRILLFNQQTRDANALAHTLYSALRDVIPVPSTERVAEAAATNSVSSAAASTAAVAAVKAPLFSEAVFSTNVTFASSPTSASQSPTAAGERERETDGKETNSKGRYKADLMSMNASALDVSQLTVQKALAETWLALDEGSAVRVDASIEDAIRYIRQVAAAHKRDGATEDVAVLVTGSLHLVGGVLEVLEMTAASS